MPTGRPLFVPVLRQKERERLRKALRGSNDGKLRDRCRAILWSEERRTTVEIGELLGVDATTVFRWIKDYGRFGFVGLIPDKSPGRPRQIDEDGEALLSRALGKNPRKLGYGFTRWTVTTLSQHLYGHLHIQVHPETVRRAVKRLGYRYKRPKLSLKHRQEPHQVRRARREREAALKKSPRGLTASPLPSGTNANATSIPA